MKLLPGFTGSPSADYCFSAMVIPQMSWLNFVFGKGGLHCQGAGRGWGGEGAESQIQDDW